MASVGVTHLAPLVIGATGGSGTRVVARLARYAGYDLGTYLNEAGDALAFQPFFDAWINPYVSGQRRGEKVTPWQSARMKEAFHAALARHIPEAERRGKLWGWKAPRSIYLLPFLYAQFPELKFVHIVRDGRDMAFSHNQNQLRKHGPAVLSPFERIFNPLPVRSILLWDRMNLKAAEFGESRLRKNYHLVSFEDLCHQPVDTTARLFLFLGAKLDAEPVAGSEVSPPTTLGRWKTAPETLVQKLERAASNALRKFGYMK